MDGEMALAVIFNILPDMPSGPVDLVVSSDDRMAVTSSTVQSNSDGRVPTLMGSSGVIGGELWFK